MARAKISGCSACDALLKNPKDKTGARKLSLSAIPTTALAHLGIAIQYGNSKHHGWRGKKVIASVYIDAILRHLVAYAEGEDCDPESAVHHLGAAMGGCAILLDAQEMGNFADDRPTDSCRLSEIYKRWKKDVHKSTSR